jgi:hypothetical protein
LKSRVHEAGINNQGSWIDHIDSDTSKGCKKKKLMKLYAVIHEMITGSTKITLVCAQSAQEARQVYLDHMGLKGYGTQLKVEEVETSKPSVILTVTQK